MKTPKLVNILKSEKPLKFPSSHLFPLELSKEEVDRIFEYPLLPNEAYSVDYYLLLLL